MPMPEDYFDDLTSFFKLQDYCNPNNFQGDINPTSTSRDIKEAYQDCIGWEEDQDFTCSLVSHHSYVTDS